MTDALNDADGSERSEPRGKSIPRDWYFVITCGEDGHNIWMMSEDQLMEELNDEEGGEGYIIEKDFIKSEVVNGEWRMKHYPINLNRFVGYCTGDKVLIIKGRVVTPEEKEKVTKYEVE